MPPEKEWIFIFLSSQFKVNNNQKNNRLIGEDSERDI